METKGSEPSEQKDRIDEKKSRNMPLEETNASYPRLSELHHVLENPQNLSVISTHLSTLNIKKCINTLQYVLECRRIASQTIKSIMKPLVEGHSNLVISPQTTTRSLPQSNGDVKKTFDLHQFCKLKVTSMMENATLNVQMDDSWIKVGIVGNQSILKE
jgi:hypothetical protein